MFLTELQARSRKNPESRFHHHSGICRQFPQIEVSNRYLCISKISTMYLYFYSCTFSVNVPFILFALTLPKWILMIPRSFFVFSESLNPLWQPLKQSKHQRHVNNLLSPCLVADCDKLHQFPGLLCDHDWTNCVLKQDGMKACPETSCLH